METMVIDHAHSTFLVGAAHLVRGQEEIQDYSSDFSDEAKASFTIEKSSPFVTWIAGDYAESGKPNQNKQYWSTADLAMAEYTILHAPLNMVHKFRTPVGFFAATNAVKLKNTNDEAAEGRIKIQALAGLWSHLFPLEEAQARAADSAKALFFSMECRAEKIKCAGAEGCQNEFAYGDPVVNNHCEHLMERSSVRQLVKPTFRGGALIIPPVKPGWKNATAHVLDSAVREEAQVYAEQYEKQYRSLASSGVTASQWESLMGMVMSSGQPG